MTDSMKPPKINVPARPAHCGADYIYILAGRKWGTIYTPLQMIAKGTN